MSSKICLLSLISSSSFTLQHLRQLLPDGGSSCRLAISSPFRCHYTVLSWHHQKYCTSWMLFVCKPCLVMLMLEQICIYPVTTVMPFTNRCDWAAKKDLCPQCIWRSRGQWGNNLILVGTKNHWQSKSCRDEKNIWSVGDRFNGWKQSAKFELFVWSQPSHITLGRTVLVFIGSSQEVVWQTRRWEKVLLGLNEVLPQLRFLVASV